MKQFESIRKTTEKFNYPLYLPKYSKWLFLITIIVLSYIYNYQDILFLRPQSLHQWRQCDCLSFTMNYYKDNNKFFEPAVHNLGNDGTGKTMSEFPIIYYTIGKLWKIFGHHEFIYRLFVLLLTFTALLALFKTIEEILTDSAWALFIVVLFFTSPMLIYYANNFLVNTPAMSLAIIGWYFFFKFYRHQNNKYLLLFCCFFLMAGLLKITSTFTFLATFMLLFAEITGIVKLKKGEKLFKNPFLQIVPFIAVFIILFIWFHYAYLYNKQYNSGFFLIGILPIWDVDKETILRIFDAIKAHYRSDYFNRWVQIILFLFLIFIVASRKRLPVFLYFLTIISSIGFFLYSLLFYQALEQHDYYVTNFLILMPLIATTFLLALRNTSSKVFFSTIFRIIALIFIIKNILFADKKLEERYSHLYWMNSKRTKYTYALEDITPYLRSIGIERDEKIIFLGDGSINISLYLMDQKGWTGYNVLQDTSRINNEIRKGAEYIMTYDSSILEKNILAPYFANKIGQQDIVEIYKINGLPD